MRNKKYIMELKGLRDLHNSRRVEVSSPSILEHRRMLFGRLASSYVLKLLQVQPNLLCFQGALFGNLNSYLDKFKPNMQTIMMIVGQLIAALEFLHQNEVVVHVLDPSEIFISHSLLTKVGNLSYASQIKDDQICNQFHRFYQKVNQFVAPQIRQKKSHNSAADWFSLGKVVQFMLLQHKRFYPNFKISSRALNFVKALTCLKPTERLGVNSLARKHQWVCNLDWQLYDRLKQVKF